MAITIGIDLGTTKLTALAVELPSGRVAASATAPTPIDVTALIRAALGLICDVSTQLGPRTEDVAGVGTTGQQHGVVLIDDWMRPISPLYGWRDGSGDEPYPDGGTWAEHARRLVGDAPARTGCRLRSGYGAVTLFAKRASLPEEFTACTLMDLFGSLLTGRRPVTDATCAASLGALDLRAGDWDAPTLAALNLRREWLPEVVPDGTELGGLLDDSGGEWTGLTPGTPVFAGVGDNQASFLGTVADPEAGALVNVGTGGQVAMHSAAFAIDDEVEARPFFGGGYLLVSAGQTGGAAFATLADFFAGLGPGRDWYATLVEHGQSAPPGCDGLTCKPFFRGTRTEPGRRASFSGLTERNFTPGHMARAVLEGVARVLAAGRDRIAALRGRPPSALFAAGNGVRSNALLAECLAAAFGATPRVPAHREEAAFGAALVAAVGSGLVPGWMSAGSVIRYDEPPRQGAVPAEPAGPSVRGQDPRDGGRP